MSFCIMDVYILSGLATTCATTDSSVTIVFNDHLAPEYIYDHSAELHSSGLFTCQCWCMHGGRDN